MVNKKLTIAVGVMPFLSGCYTFSDLSDFNLPIPEYFADRDYISVGEAQFANNLDSLPGRIAYKNAAGKYVFMTQTVIAGSVTPQTKAVESAYYYSSVINKNYSASGNFPVVAADLTGKTATSYELRDVATVLIPSNGEPSRPDFQKAASAALAPSNVPLYWVSGAALSDLRQQISTNLNGKTQVSGEAFSMSGTVYDSKIAADWIPLISVYVIPMNAAADAEVASKPAQAVAAAPGAKGNISAIVAAMTNMTKKQEAIAPSPFPSRLPHQKNGTVAAIIEK